jgi:hypothetical protein
MSTFLNVVAFDKSTYVVTAVFADSTGAAVTPTEITWTLTNTHGEVVNSRSEVPVTVPASTVSITLYGADLDKQYGNKRRFLIEAVYDSTDGDNLPLRGAVAFAITSEEVLDPSVESMSP